MTKAIITDKMVEALQGVPTLSISESVKEKLSIKSVKDLTQYSNLRQELAITGNYLVWFSDGNGMYIDLPSEQIEQFLLNLTNQ